MAIWVWVAFLVFVLLMLALDLGVFNREDHVIGTREAFGWTALWVALALLFTVPVYYLYESDTLRPTDEPAVQTIDGEAVRTGPRPDPIGNGHDAVVAYLTGYITEKSLSLDNIFVIALIFGYVGVPPKYQHRVLYWGILGALVMRALMIFAGIALVRQFEWVIYLFAVFLIYSAIKMLGADEENVDFGEKPLVRLVRRLYPVSDHLDGHDFFTRVPDPAVAAQPQAEERALDADDEGVLAADPAESDSAKKRWAMTPLLLALILVEGADVAFAVDSIPAIIGITEDEFIVFSSNVFAILGLRSLYFALASLLPKFRYLKLSLAVLLGYIGVKMLVPLAGTLTGHDHLHIPNLVSLGIIATILTVGVVASLLAAPKPSDDVPHTPG